MTVSAPIWQRLVAIGAVTISLAATLIALVFDSGSALGYDLTYPMLAISFLGLVTLGSIVIIKQVAPRVGWILIIGGLGGTTSVFGEKMTLVGSGRGWSVESMQRLLSAASIGFSVMLAGLALLFLLFPNGEPKSRRWRVVVGVTVVAAVVLISSTPFLMPYVLDPEPFLRGNWDWSVAGSDVPTALIVWVNGSTGVAVAAIVAGAISLVLRLRTSRGVERQQVKWVVYTGVAAAVGWFIALSFPLPAAVEVVPAGVGAIMLTAGLAISLLRFRLYDIDRVISRTVGYAVVVGLLGLVYAAGAIWLPSQLAGDSPLFVAGSTLAVVGLFNPVRRQALKLVDRRFYRSRYNAEKMVEEFSNRLQDQVDVDRLAIDLVSVVNETMQPSSLGVWVKET